MPLAGRTGEVCWPDAYLCCAPVIHLMIDAMTTETRSRTTLISVGKQLHASPQTGQDRACLVRQSDGTERAFYLRIKVEAGIEHVDLDNAVTPREARQMAISQGYAPTHWMTVGDLRPTRFY